MYKVISKVYTETENCGFERHVFAIKAIKGGYTLYHGSSYEIMDYKEPFWYRYPGVYSMVEIWQQIGCVVNPCYF